VWLHCPLTGESLAEILSATIGLGSTYTHQDDVVLDPACGKVWHIYCLWNLTGICMQITGCMFDQYSIALMIKEIAVLPYYSITLIIAVYYSSIILVLW